MPGRRKALWAVATAVVAVAAALGWLFTADLGIFKAELASRITRASGREFEIRGDFSVHLGRRAVLVAEGIYWRNARWADEPYMLQIGQVEAEVDLLSAMRGPLIIERVVVRDARVSVARNANNESNWAVFESGRKTAPGQPDDVSPRFLLRHARLSNVGIRLDGAMTREPLDLRIRSMRQDVGKDDVITASLDVTSDNREISVSGKVGTWSSMVRHDPVHIEIAARLGSTRIRSSGMIDSLADPRHPQLSFSVRGPSSGDLFALVGLGGPVSGDVDLHGSLHPADDGSLRLRIRGNLGQCRVAVSGSLPDLRDFDPLEVEARASGPNLRHVLAGTRIQRGSEIPFTLEVDAVSHGPSLSVRAATLDIGDARLAVRGSVPALPSLTGATMSARLDGSRIERLQRLLPLPAHLSGPFAVDAELELLSEGVHAREGTAVRFGGHTARIEGLIGTGAALRGSDLNIGLSGRSAADLGRTVYPIADLPAAPYDIRGTVQIDDSGYRLRRVTSRIGGSTLRLEGLVSRRRGLAGSHGAVSIEGAALEDWLPALRRHRVRRGPFSLSSDIVVESETIRFSRVRFEHELASVSAAFERARPWSVNSASFSVQGRGQDVRALLGQVGPFEPAALPWSLTVDGDRRGRAWTIRRLDVSLGDAQASISGTFDYDEKLQAPRLTVDGATPDLERLGSFAGRSLPRRSVAVRTRLIGDEHGLAAPGLHIDVDEGSIDGDIYWRPREVPFLGVRLRSDQLDLPPHRSQPKKEVTETPSAAGRLIPDVQVPFDAFGRMDVSLQLDIARLVRGTLRLRDFVLSAELSDGGLEVSELRFRGQSGTFHGKAALKPAGGAGYARALLTAEGLRLDLDTDDRFEGMTVSSFVRVASSGTSLRALASHADGVLLVDARNGRLSNSGLLQAMYGDLIQELLSKINPFFKDREYTQLECVVAPMQITDGRIESAPATLVLTGEVQMAVQNAIDLGTEEIDVHLRTTPRETLGISAGEMVNPYIKIAGTLAEPRLTIDREGAAVAGGTAIATGGLSVVAKAAWDRLSKSGNPCGTAAAEARQMLRE